MSDPHPATDPLQPAGPVLADALAAVRRHAPDGEGRWLLVDVARQRLHLVVAGVPVAAWTVSTAAAGIDAREGSGGTPPGAHRIARRIGDGAPSGAVFSSREPTGQVWPRDLPPDHPEDLILTRVLTLAGLEDGRNRGPGVDSTDRYIYIHGTNAEASLGRPCSHGCVRMANTDIIALFDLVQEGDPVVIV